MRITGGQARGQIISGPKGLGVRPTASKIRQALFNILANRIEHASFLDLFAGTGLIGLEALSRGASSLVAVEENRKMAKAIESNLNRFAFEGEVIIGDIANLLPSLQGAVFDIIFADPPYKSQLATSVLHGVERYNLLADNGLFVIEHVKGYFFGDNIERLILTDRRDYGQASLSFFQKQPDPDLELERRSPS